MSFDARLAASIFFPQFAVLRCDVDQSHTPSVLQKIARAATRDCYESASKSLEELAELKVSPKQCQRIAIRIGKERIAEQEERTADYLKLTIPAQRHGQPASAPLNDWKGRVAVVSADGGRTQIRDELWGEEKPHDKKHRWWRESQCAVLQTILSTPSTIDPHPEVPSELKDPLWIVPKIKEMHRQRAASSESDKQEPSSKSQPAAKSECEVAQENEDTRWSGGEPLVKTVIATRKGYDQLGVLMATEAYQRGFNKAKSKAFLGDGLKVNWTIWSRHFSHYIAITDLMHALSYVYTAAIVVHDRIEDGWAQYIQWLELVWGGRVLEVVDQMKTLVPKEGDAPEDLTAAITYLTNNAERMRYDEYRTKGLPITTSRVESTQKQVNRRVKGTEKFWRDESLEPVLQLVSDDLSETFDADAFWQRRQNRFLGLRIRNSRIKVDSSQT
jgi:hypothetical protein